MRRMFFTSQVVPGLIEEYRRRHAEVWPDMFARCAPLAGGTIPCSCGMMACSSARWLLMISVVQAAMEKTNVNALWQADMARFFVALPGGRPDNSMVVLTEIFNLDDQLARIEKRRRVLMSEFAPSQP